MHSTTRHSVFAHDYSIYFQTCLLCKVFGNQEFLHCLSNVQRVNIFFFHVQKRLCHHTVSSKGCGNLIHSRLLAYIDTKLVIHREGHT